MKRRWSSSPKILPVFNEHGIERMLAQEPPPWVVHVRTGNRRVADFRVLLDAVWPRVWALLEDHKLVILYRDYIEAVRCGG